MQLLVLLAIFIFVVAAAWSVHTVGITRNRTISQHVGKRRKTTIVFGILGAFATLLSSYALFTWLLPAHNAHTLSYIVFGLLMLGFFTAAVIPYIEKTRRGFIHNIAAWGMCYLVPIAILSSLFWDISLLVKAFSVVFAISTVTLLILFSTRKKLRQSMLYFQSGYLGIFFLFLVTVAYF